MALPIVTFFAQARRQTKPNNSFNRTPLSVDRQSRCLLGGAG